MDMKQLQYFVTIAEEGTISGAARKLYMSQPPLSLQIKLLEKELNCVLFERGARQIKLTQAGKILYDRAITLLRLADVTKKEINDYTNGTHGTLRIGVVSSVCSSLMTKTAFLFNKRYPNVQFELFEANTYELNEKLSADIIELAIVRTPFNANGFECIHIFEEPMLAIGRKDFFRGCEGNSIPITFLSKKPLIIYRRWEKILFEAFEKKNIHADIFCKNDSAINTAFWADNGLGIGIIPKSSVELVKNQDTIYKVIEEKDLYSSICIVCNKNSYVSTIARNFIDFVKQHSDTLSYYKR